MKIDKGTKNDIIILRKIGPHAKTRCAFKI